MTNSWAVTTTGLTKSYGEVRVLAGVDLRVERGSVFALLGPNGAGKTTTVRILSTLVRPDAGAAAWPATTCVRQRRQVRRASASPGSTPRVDDLQTGAREPADDGPAARRVRAAARAAPTSCWSAFDLADAAGAGSATYSGGMRRRLDLAASLVGRPDGDLPRRADDRARPAAAGRPCGRSSAPGRRRA